ncbi:MAG TPA: RNA polymerase sigma-70 factor [Cyclobacteriaceae bacterium]|nr:RNA polymerase sigma-70 factor [Cyclobacteriaceae bacterium]
MHNLSEAELIKAIREGNAEVFRQVFDTCYENLCQYAFTILKESDQAEDVVQSIMMKLWERREELDIKTSVRSYLFRAVYNQCINQLEHSAIKKKYDASIQHSHDRDEQQPDVFPAELEESIRKAVDSLPTECRKIFIMSRYDELKYSEIAEKLDISVNTIQNQICKALKILREQLKDRGF